MFYEFYRAFAKLLGAEDLGGQKNNKSLEKCSQELFSFAYPIAHLRVSSNIVSNPPGCKGGLVIFGNFLLGGRGWEIFGLQGGGCPFRAGCMQTGKSGKITKSLESQGKSGNLKKM